MSVFRFEATPTTSKPLSKKMKGKGKDVKGPTFAFSISPSLLQDITLDKTEGGIRTTASSGLTMKEYEEQLKKLTAENFNLKLKVYFVEERLSKVTGISDKEDLIKKNIQLKVTCESQLKELEKKQELLFEASKAFELLQKEHTEEIEKLTRERNKEIAELTEKLSGLEATHAELKSRFPNLDNCLASDVKSIEQYEKQVRELELNLQEEEDKSKEMENMLKDTQLELESFQLKSQRLENELEQRTRRIEELVNELELKERDLASANFKIRKLEDEIKSKHREDEIMKERIEEKNKTIESLKSSLASRDETIEVLENRVAKERSSAQSLQSKIDGLSFQNSRLKEELEILQSRLRRTAEALSPRGKQRPPDDEYKQKYEEVVRVLDEQDAKHSRKVRELEDKLQEKLAEAEDYRELFEKHKKLEDDHRKACTALKNFIKRSSDEKKEREGLNQLLSNHEEVIADLRAQLERYKNEPASRDPHDEKLSLAETGDNKRKFAADNDGTRSERNSFQEAPEKGEDELVGTLEKVSELEAEVIVLEHQMGSEEQDITKQLLLNELETKKCEIEKLNGELARRNANMQEIVNKELWDKNRRIEKLESRLTELSLGEEDKKDVGGICYLLAERLEELAEFLDSLLTNSALLNGIGTRKRQDIKQAMERSRELSRQFLNDKCHNRTESSFCPNESLAVVLSRDKVISEQTILINKLRDQLKVLNQEIRQRDIELSHCQGDHGLSFLGDKDNSSEQGIEEQSLSICQEISDYEEEMEKLHETSESEAWSEPDRSVSLARMGLVEDVAASHGGSSSESSSEGTLNENSRTLGKRGRNEEVRRLQSKIKNLDELNESLREEVNSLRNEKLDSFASRLMKNEEANLMEKLRKTMSRLDECSLTCRQLEEKLAGALERASSSAMQLSRAQETISILEEEMRQLKESLAVKTLETKEKTERIKELEQKIEEIQKESEEKLAEATKQREKAERKTIEVECRLKEAENISKEVESRVNEIEKRITETKKLKKETATSFKEAEKHVDTAEKMMEEAERMKEEAEKKSKDFQSFIDLMRKEVEEKMKEGERKVKKSEREKEELERQVAKLKKRLLEAEKNKLEVETKVKEGKETIQCMEEKLKELEVAMDQCGEEAQRRIKEMQKKADARVAELEMKMEERDWARKTEVERKMAEAERLSRELEIGFRRQLEEAERRVKRAKENAEAAIRAIKEDTDKQQFELKQRIAQLEAEKKEETAELRRKLDEAKLEASELELELTKLTNEKIHLEEELKRLLDKETALERDNKEIKGKYESSIHELENKLTQLTLNKAQLASRLEEIETTNVDLVSRISALRGKETSSMVVEHEFTAFAPPVFFGDFDYGPELKGSKIPLRQGSTASDPGGEHGPGMSPPRRNMNSSPDLGIESDPGRFSSLEANQHVHGDQLGILGNSEMSEMKKLEFENAELKRRLLRTRQALEETLSQLSAANQRKKQVERAICKQLHKTHHILKKARVNFESQDGESVE